MTILMYAVSLLKTSYNILTIKVTTKLTVSNFGYFHSCEMVRCYCCYEPCNSMLRTGNPVIIACDVLFK